MKEIPSCRLAQVFDLPASPNTPRNARSFRISPVISESISGGTMGYLSAMRKIEKREGSSSLFELMEVVPAVFYDVDAVELVTADARPGYTRHVRGFANDMLEINRLSSVSSDTESELLRHRLMTDIIIKIDSHLADNLLIFSKEELSVRGGATDHETQLLMGRIGDLFSEALHNRLGALTLLPNASVFEAAAESAEKEFVEGSKEFSMILADIDDLKSLNHNHSYAAGDSVLAEVADRFRNTLADLGYKGSVVFRPGKSKFIHGLRDDKEAGANPALKHDEFVVLLPQPVEKAAKIAKQMSSSVADTPFEFEIPLQGGDYATCSFGMVGSSDVAAEGGRVWRKMLDMCVFQLNAAKRQGGNQIVY